MLPASPRRTRRVSRSTLLAALLAAGTLTIAEPASAQPAAKSAKTAKAAMPTLVGTWTGTATVPLPDSSIVVPVIYNFTQATGAIGGTAIVPGQGSGTISNVSRDGARLQFRVTAPEGRLLEHDGKFGADGSVEGVVNMDNQPIAKFKIAPKRPAKPAK